MAKPWREQFIVQIEVAKREAGEGKRRPGDPVPIELEGEGEFDVRAAIACVGKVNDAPMSGLAPGTVLMTSFDRERRTEGPDRSRGDLLIRVNPWGWILGPDGEYHPVSPPPFDATDVEASLDRLFPSSGPSTSNPA